MDKKRHLRKDDIQTTKKKTQEMFNLTTLKKKKIRHISIIKLVKFKK